MTKIIGKYVIGLCNRMLYIQAAYAVSLVIFASIYSSIEPIGFFKSIYFGIILSTTIGLGDISPTTDLGRVVVSCFALLWAYVLVPLVIANILVKAIKDSDKFTDQEQKELFALVSEIKAKLDKHD